MDTQGKENVSLEQSIFKALDHQNRRDVLRVIGERKSITFTEIMNSIKTQPFIEQHDGKYRLTRLGKSAYNLLTMATSYSKEAQVFQRKSSVIIGTTFMWVCAIAAAMVINADTFYYSIILPVLSGTSIWLINWLYED
jgi:hypothetical protein